MDNRIFKHKNIISYVIILFLTILSFKAVCLSQSELAFIDDAGFPLGGTNSIVSMLHSAQIESAQETEGTNARLVENRQTLIRSNLLRSAASFDAMPLQRLMPVGILIIICRLLFLIISLSLIFIMPTYMTRTGGKNYYPYFMDQDQKGRIVMLEKVIIIICIAVCLGAAIIAWWMENGPSHEEDEKDADDKTISADKN